MTTVNCQFCHGSGKCYSCNGEGSVKRLIGVDQIKSMETQVCGACAGTGQCVHCRQNAALLDATTPAAV